MVAEDEENASDLDEILFRVSYMQATGIGVGGILKYPPGRKFLENPPPGDFGKIFEKPGKTEKIR